MFAWPGLGLVTIAMVSIDLWLVTIAIDLRLGFLTVAMVIYPLLISSAAGMVSNQ